MAHALRPFPLIPRVLGEAPSQKRAHTVVAYSPPSQSAQGLWSFGFHGPEEPRAKNMT